MNLDTTPLFSLEELEDSIMCSIEGYINQIEVDSLVMQEKLARDSLIQGMLARGGK